MSPLQDTLSMLYHWWLQDEFLYGTEEPTIWQQPIDTTERFIDRNETT